MWRRDDELPAAVTGRFRRILFLYEPADPLSAMWAKLQAERGFVPRSEAAPILREQGEANQKVPAESA